MSLIQTPWTSQPQQAVGIDWSNPITRGLVYCKNLALETGFTKVGTKIVASKQGSALGFGSTFGVGATDSVETTLTTSSTARTILVVYNRNGTGGGTAGRVFDKRTVSGQVEEMQTGGAGMLYGGSWTGGTGLFNWPAQPFGTPVNCVISYDKSSTSNVPLVAENGVRLSVTTSSAPSGSVITNTDPYVIGNRKNDNARNWDGTISLFAVFDRALSEQEAKSLSQNPWQIFKPTPRRIFVPVSAGGGVTINAGTGNADAAGLTASVSQAASIAAGVGNAAAAGLTASIAQQYTLSAGVGNAAAAGLTATITASGLTTISCTTGNASAAGATATVNSSATITCSTGNAAAAGLTAALDIAFTILANVGNATGAGLSATIQAATGISCGVANAIAAGLTSSITNNAPLTDSEKLDLILDILSNRQTLNPATGVYTLYADDGVTVLKTAQAWEDAAGTIPYRGRALQRLDAMA